MQKVKVRLGQRLIKVAFRGGEPYFKFGVVSRVTRTTFDVNCDGVVEKSITDTGKYGVSGWYKTNWLAAIDHQIEDVFRSRQFLIKHSLNDWPVSDLVGLVNRLWRFRKKCLKKLHRSEKVQNAK